MKLPLLAFRHLSPLACGLALASLASAGCALNGAPDDTSGASDEALAERPHAVSELTAKIGQACPDGFTRFAWDGHANIAFCVKYTDAPDATSVSRVSAELPWRNTTGYELGIDAKYCIDGKRFAYDGTTGLSYCLYRDPGSFSYVSEVSANMGRQCPPEWHQFAWNGTANISFCNKSAAR